MTRRCLWTVTALLLGGLGGCKADSDLPATLIAGPRVLAIVAEPPSVAPGESTTVTAFIVGAGGDVPVVSWTRCRRAPQPGDATNPDCVRVAQADYLEPIGEGPTITTTMPGDATAEALGKPDATGGVYLTLVARVAVSGQTLLATYRLRLGSAAGGNRNPVLTGLAVVEPSGSTTPLDDASPRVVRAGDRLTLTAAIAPDSLQTYLAPLGGDPATEVLSTSWFSTAGTFSRQRSDGLQATTVLQLDDHLPTTAGAIDLYAVTRDDRGGAAYIQRALAFE